MVTHRTRREMRNSEGRSEGENYSRRMMHKPAEMIGEYPVSSVLLVFGVGLGVGFVLGQALCESTAGYFHQPTMSERWGRSMYDSLSHMVPESVSRRFAS
jgi:hypothetical protein